MNSFSSFEDVLRFPYPGLKKNVSDIKQTWVKLRKLHQTRSDHADSSTLIYLLPFTSHINQCMCKALQDIHGHINWRLLLGAVTILVSGAIAEKIELIRLLFELELSSSRSTRAVLKDILRSSQRIAISLNAEAAVGGSVNQKHNIGSSRYHGEDNLGLLVDHLISDHLEHEASIELRKPLRFTWSGGAGTDNSIGRTPCSRAKHSACLHGHKIYLLGGRDGRYPVRDMWSYNLITECWEEVKGRGDYPPPLEEHTMVSYGDEILVFGGVSRMSVDGETPFWIFNTVSNIWRHWKADSEVTLPTCLRGHTTVLVGKNMYIFGGYEDILGSTELMWSFDIVGEYWNLVYSQSLRGSGPGPRHYHTATVHNHNMIVIGGLQNLNPVSDMWSFNFRVQNWTKLKPVSPIPTVYNHSAIKLANSIYIYGGQNQSGLTKQLLEYRIESGVWKSKDTLMCKGPTSRSHHVSLLAPPSAYNTVQHVPERSRSVPVVKQNTTTISERPNTCPAKQEQHGNRKPLRFHRNTRDLTLKTFHVNQKLLNTAKDKLTPERTIDENNNTQKPQWPVSCSDQSALYRQIGNSVSDYAVAYVRSDSDELLLKRSSTYSNNSFTFDNPAYMNSYDELTTKVAVGGVQSITTERIRLSSKPYRPGSSNYAKLSRSLDSIQDFVHDSSVIGGSAVTLPGAVLARSDETVNETCTVRNIMLDECSQAWDTTWDDTEDDDVTLRFEEPITSENYKMNNRSENTPYRLFVLGGLEKGYKTPGSVEQLKIWKCDIIGKR